MRNVKLTRKEAAIESALLKGELADVDSAEFQAIAQTLAVRRKDAVLNIRINSADLRRIKLKAQQLGVKYQTFVSEILHKVAQA